jgi:ADP-heptose:LPS heptosyltransferase
MELLQADISITLSDQQFSNGQNTVLLLICGANLAKHWPLDYWKIINDQLINSSFETLAIIGPNEKWLIPEIERLKIPFKEVNLLDDLFDFIQGACGVISNDCGPMHVSLMLNKPTLAIFGPTNPNSWFLRTNQHQACAQTNYSYMNRSQAPLLKPWPSWPQPSEIYDKFIKLIDANLIKT